MSDSGSRGRRQVDDLAKVAIIGSMEQVLETYGDRLRAIGKRWDLELELSSGDVRAALVSMKGRRLALDVAARRIRARRVARRLKRAHVLAAGITRRAIRLPREYRKQFLSGLEDSRRGAGANDGAWQ